MRKNLLLLYALAILGLLVWPLRPLLIKIPPVPKPKPPSLNKGWIGLYPAVAMYSGPFIPGDCLVFSKETGNIVDGGPQSCGSGGGTVTNASRTRKSRKLPSHSTTMCLTDTSPLNWVPCSPETDIGKLNAAPTRQY